MRGERFTRHAVGRLLGCDGESHQTTTHTSPRPRRTVAARRDARWRGLAPHGPTAHDDNGRLARVKDSHLNVRESTLGGRTYSPGAVEDALRGDMKRGIGAILRGRHVGAMGGSGRRVSDEQDVRTARPIVAPKRAKLREHEWRG